MCHHLILFIGIQQSIFFSSDFVQWRLAFGDERLFKNLPDLINWTSFTKEIVHWEWWALAISEWNIFHSGIYCCELFFLPIEGLRPMHSCWQCLLLHAIFSVLSFMIYVSHIGQFLQNGKYEHNISKKKFLKLYCDHTVWFFS